MNNKVLVLGGDGFCGWPTSLYLSNNGYEVTLIDNLSRRNIDNELSAYSLTPISSISERISAWQEVSGKCLNFYNIDIANEYHRIVDVIKHENPHAVIHFAEQRAAPYSMKSPQHKCYTVNNNINATHNLLCAIVETGLDIHLVHLGTAGVYGYGTAGIPIPEGYLDIEVPTGSGERIPQQILYPANPGSIYHMTKTLDQLLFFYYNKNDSICITDLHQGIVWGTNTQETLMDERLINRFDYDGDYGTVLNRFLVQAAIGYPLTVHGSGGQTRAFINIQDTVKCIKLAIENPNKTKDRVNILNQVVETHRIKNLASMIAEIADVSIAHTNNPRKEAAENDLVIKNEHFLKLGLNPIKLNKGLLNEIEKVAVKYAHRIDKSRIPCTSIWTKDQDSGLPESIE